MSIQTPTTAAEFEKTAGELGCCEPVSGQVVSDPWQAAIDYGIDVDQLAYVQTLTPLERIERHDQALQLVRALREAGIRYYGFDPRLPEPPRPPER